MLFGRLIYIIDMSVFVCVYMCVCVMSCVRFLSIYIRYKIIQRKNDYTYMGPSDFLFYFVFLPRLKNIHRLQ